MMEDCYTYYQMLEILLLCNDAKSTTPRLHGAFCYATAARSALPVLSRASLVDIKLDFFEALM